MCQYVTTLRPLNIFSSKRWNISLSLWTVAIVSLYHIRAAVFFILVTINCYFQNFNWIPVSLNIIKLDSRRCIPRTTPGPSWWWLFAALLSTALQQHLDVDFYSWGASIAKLLAFIRRSSSLLSSVQMFWWLTNRCRKDQSFVQMNIGLSPHLKFSRIDKKNLFAAVSWVILEKYSEILKPSGMIVIVEFALNPYLDFNRYSNLIMNFKFFRSIAMHMI